MAPRRCTYVPALSHEDTDEEETQESSSRGPSVSSVGRTLIEIGLIYLVERASSVSPVPEVSCNLAYSS